MSTDFTTLLNLGDRLPNYQKESIIINSNEYVTDISVNRSAKRLLENDLYLYQKTLGLEEAFNYQTFPDLSVSAKWESCYSEVKENSANWNSISTNGLVAVSHREDDTRDFIPAWLDTTSTRVKTGYGIEQAHNDGSAAYIPSNDYIPTTELMKRAIGATVESQRVLQLEITENVPAPIPEHIAIWHTDKIIKDGGYSIDDLKIFESCFKLSFSCNPSNAGILSTTSSYPYDNQYQYVVPGGYIRPVTATANSNFSFVNWTGPTQDTQLPSTTNILSIGSVNNLSEDNVQWGGNYVANFEGSLTPINFEIDPPRQYGTDNNIIDTNTNLSIFSGTSESSVIKNYNYWDTVSFKTQFGSRFKWLTWEITPTPDVEFNYDWTNDYDFNFRLNKNSYNIKLIAGHDLIPTYLISQIAVDYQYVNNSWINITNNNSLRLKDAYSTDTDMNYIHLRARPVDPNNYAFNNWVIKDGDSSDVIGGRDTSWRSVAFSPTLDKYVAVGQQVIDNYREPTDVDKQVMYSTDVENWSLGYINGGLDATRWSSVCWGNGKFVAVNEWYGTFTRHYPAIYSTDGITWNVCNETNFTGFWQSVTWCGDRFIAVGRTDLEVATVDASIMSSLDGITWTKITNPIAYGFSKICWNGKSDSNKAIIATVYDTRRYTGYSGSDASTTNPFLTKGIIQSSDGITWSAIDTPTQNSYREKWICAAWNYNDNYFVVGAQEAPTNYRIITSNNGLGTGWVFSPYKLYNECKDISHSGVGGVFAMITRNGIISDKFWTSIDGVTWGHVNDNTAYGSHNFANTNDWESVCWGSKGWVAVSSGPHSNDSSYIYQQAKAYRVAYSSDNDNWYRKVAAQIFDITDISTKSICPILKCALTQDLEIFCTSDYKVVNISFYCVNVDTNGNLISINDTVNPQGTLVGETKQKIKIGQTCTPVIATPVTGYKFDRWETSNVLYTKFNTDITNSLQFIAQGDDVEFFAYFELNPTYTVTVDHDSNCTVNISSQANILLNGDSQTITATPNEGYLFTKWTTSNVANISPNNTSSSIIIKDITNNITVYANSIAKPMDTKQVKFSAITGDSVITTGLTITDTDNSNTNITDSIQTKTIGSTMHIKANSANNNYIFKGSVQIRTFDDSGTGNATLSISDSDITISNIQDNILVKVIFENNIQSANISLTIEPAWGADTGQYNLTTSVNVRSLIKLKLASAGITLNNSDIITSINCITYNYSKSCYHGSDGNSITEDSEIAKAGGIVTIAGNQISNKTTYTIPIFNNITDQKIYASGTVSRVRTSTNAGGGGGAYRTAWGLNISKVTWKTGTQKKYSVLFKASTGGTISIQKDSDINKDVIKTRISQTSTSDVIIWSTDGDSTETSPIIVPTGNTGKIFNKWTSTPTAAILNPVSNILNPLQLTGNAITKNTDITGSFKKG